MALSPLRFLFLIHMNSDIIIIGAGPGGYETALYAAKKGLSVTLFEERRVGGTCLQEGCIPTKCFCRSAEVADTVADSQAMGIITSAPTVDMARIVARKNEVVTQLTAGIEFLLKNKLITYVPERAELLDAHSVKSASGETYTARHMLIATGSTAKIPPIEGSRLPGVVTSTQLLDIDHIPARLCIVGAGVIGLEFASIFRSLGSAVTMLEFAKEILPNFDTDISKRLKQVLGKRGIEFFNQAGVKSIEPSGPGLTVRYTWKNQEHTVEADTVLIATGRAPRVEGLGLDRVGIHYSPKGIKTDDNLQTNVPDIYAIGDVNGRCMLAHAASFQGRKVIDHLLGEESGIDLHIIPSAVFTRPEAGMVGLTEEECKQQGIAFTARKSLFRANGKAVSMGEPDGLCKLIADKNGRIIGGHIFGAHAADLVQEIAALMNRGTTIAQLKTMVHAHPTLSEVLQECAREF